jgi:hypothetical protein
MGATEGMNAALGGLFTSRINQQLREMKGYTCGMFSGMTAGHDDGRFAVRGSVRTPMTGAALGDLYKQLDARARSAPRSSPGRATPSCGRCWASSPPTGRSPTPGPPACRPTTWCGCLRATRR